MQLWGGGVSATPTTMITMTTHIHDSIRPIRLTVALGLKTEAGLLEEKMGTNIMGWLGLGQFFFNSQ